VIRYTEEVDGCAAASLTQSGAVAFAISPLWRTTLPRSPLAASYTLLGCEERKDAPDGVPLA
jgi:hypothetical protein